MIESVNPVAAELFGFLKILALGDECPICYEERCSFELEYDRVPRNGTLDEVAIFRCPTTGRDRRFSMMEAFGR